MARIWRVEINHFRCLETLTWCPLPGINCLIGPGDTGKSTALDAIDFGPNARRVITFTDADFYGLDVSKPIGLSITLGEPDDSLKNLEVYANFLSSNRPAL